MIRKSLQGFQLLHMISLQSRIGENKEVAKVIENHAQENRIFYQKGCLLRPENKTEALENISKRVRFLENEANKNNK